MNKEEMLAFLAVKKMIQALPKSAKKESEILAVKTALVTMNEACKSAILDLDNNVIDKFLQDVTNGVFGTDFKTKVERIHQPRGKKTEVKKSDEELLSEAFNIDLSEGSKDAEAEDVSTDVG